MNLAAQDIIKASLRVIGAIAKSEVPTNDEMQDGLQALNMIIDEWSAQGLMNMAGVQVSKVLTAGKGSYTIGLSGADIISFKPYSISYAFIRDSNNIDLPIEVRPREVYDNQIDKTTQARPILLSYDPGIAQQASPLGTILLYYVPDASTTYTLFMECQQALSELGLITSSITFDPMYARALKYALAVEIWGEYHEDKQGAPQSVTMQMEKALKVIRSVNHQPRVAPMEVPGVKSVFNIYTGDYIGQ